MQRPRIRQSRPPTRYVKAAIKVVKCPYCGADIGHRCLTVFSTVSYSSVHMDRRRALMKYKREHPKEYSELLRSLT